MQALSQSPFLQALGYAIANSLWQVALLWIAVVILNSLLKLSSQALYKVAITAQLAGFAWFLITLQFYYLTCSEALASVQSMDIESNASLIVQPEAQSFRSQLLAFVVKAEQLLPYLSIAYLGLLSFLSLKWVKCYKHTQHIKIKGLEKIDVNWRLFVKKMSAQLSIKKEIKIYLSNIISSPLTIGFLKPVILIPIASLNHLTTEQLEAVIFHELAHIKRADYFINLIQSIIETALFFNPFTQLLSKLIRKERENSCDDWVLQFQYNASMYAEALLRIAYLQTQSAFAMNATGKKSGDLLSRVRRLLNQRENRFNYRNQLVALLLITGILSSVAWLQAPLKTKEIQVKEIKPVVVEPLTAQVENPFFNPVFFLSKPLKEEVNKAANTAIDNIDKAKTGLQQTADVFSKIAPGVIENFDDYAKDIDENILNASEDARDEISKIDWPSIKMGDAFLIDSSAMKNVMKLAFDQKKKIKIDWKQVKQSLLQAKEQINLLSKNKEANFWNEDELKKSMSKALAELKNLPLNFAFPALQQHAPNTKFEKAQELQKELELKQRELLRGKRTETQRLYEMQLIIDSIRNTPTIRTTPAPVPPEESEAYEQAPATWSFSNPVYKITDETPPNISQPYIAASFKEAEQTNKKEKIVIIKYNNNEATGEGESKLIKITAVTSNQQDGASYNIIIEIQ